MKINAVPFSREGLNSRHSTDCTNVNSTFGRYSSDILGVICVVMNMIATDTDLQPHLEFIEKSFVHRIL